MFRPFFGVSVSIFLLHRGLEIFLGRFVFCFYVVLQKCLEFFFFFTKVKKKNTYNVQSVFCVFCVFCRPNAHSGSAWGRTCSLSSKARSGTLNPKIWKLWVWPIQGHRFWFRIVSLLPEPPPLGSCTLPNIRSLSPGGPSQLPHWSGLEFLQEKLAAGAAATILRIYVAAIAALRELDEIPLGRHRMVSAFMRGVRCTPH